MKRLDDPSVDKYRCREQWVYDRYGWIGDHTGGLFIIQYVGELQGSLLNIIASVGMGWDHVSVSTPERCPTWEEMSFVKDLFFKPDETAMQLHVPADDHINHHPFCLHLWRPHVVEIPRPPSILVGPKGRKHEQP